MRFLRRPLSIFCAVGCLAPLTAASCGPASPKATDPTASTSTSTSASADLASPRVPKPIDATVVGTFPEGTFGPRVSRGVSSSIIVFASPSPAGRRWVAIPLDGDKPKTDARHELAEAPEDESIAFDVQPMGDGFLLAWTKRSDAGEQLFAMSLSADGSPHSAPQLVARGEDLGWLNIVSLPGKTGLLTFGDKSILMGTAIAKATLYGASIDSKGRIGTSGKIADNLSAWRVVPVGGHVLAAVVERLDVGGDASGAAKKGAKPVTFSSEHPRAAKLHLVTPGAKGFTIADSLTISGDAAQPEIHAVSSGPSTVTVVFGDHRNHDSQLFSAAVEVTSGKLKLRNPARRAVPPRGDQSLVALLPSTLGPVLLWEDVFPRAVGDSRRRFSMARLDETGLATSSPRAILYPYELEEPEIVSGPASDEVSLLTYGRACLIDDEKDPTKSKCDDKDIRPYVLGYGGPTLAPRRSTLLDLGPLVEGPAKRAFDLSCNNSRCDALVVSPGKEAQIALASLPPIESVAFPRWRYSDGVEISPKPPRLEGATTSARENVFAGLAAARTATGTAIAWLTYVADEVDTDPLPATPAPITKGKKGKPETRTPKKEPKRTAKKELLGAKVGLRMIDAMGEPLGPVTVISERALSKGDVGLAFGPDGRGLVAYASRAEGDEEIYVAKIDSSGKKDGGSVRITKSAGSVSDVALVNLADGGFFLAWIDGRKGPPAVYGVSLDKNGSKIGGEVKIGGGSGGDVSDLSIALVGKTTTGGSKIALVWSDARDELTNGFADVYMAIVPGKSPDKPLVAEKVLLKSKLHSHAPHVVARGDGTMLVSWLEDDPSATEMLDLSGKPDWGAYVAKLDANGSSTGAAQKVTLDPALGLGVVSGLSADCPAGPSSCRLGLVFGNREGIVILGSSVGDLTAIVPAKQLWSYFGAATQEVAPTLLGSSLYLCEDGLEKDDGRIRRLAINW